MMPLPYSQEPVKTSLTPRLSSFTINTSAGSHPYVKSPPGPVIPPINTLSSSIDTSPHSAHSKHPSASRSSYTNASSHAAAPASLSSPPVMAANSSLPLPTGAHESHSQPYSHSTSSHGSYQNHHHRVSLPYIKYNGMGDSVSGGSNVNAGTGARMNGQTHPSQSPYLYETTGTSSYPYPQLTSPPSQFRFPPIASGSPHSALSPPSSAAAGMPMTHSWHASEKTGSSMPPWHASEKTNGSSPSSDQSYMFYKFPNPDYYAKAGSLNNNHNPYYSMHSPHYLSHSQEQYSHGHSRTHSGTHSGHSLHSAFGSPHQQQQQHAGTHQFVFPPAGAAHSSHDFGSKHRSKSSVNSSNAGAQSKNGKAHRRKRSKSSPKSQSSAAAPLISKFSANPISQVGQNGNSHLNSHHMGHKASSSMSSFSYNNDGGSHNSFSFATNNGTMLGGAGGPDGKTSIEQHSSSKINFPICQLPTGDESNSVQIPMDKLNDLKNAIYPQIEIKKYSTSAIDPMRTYLVVFEYQINDHWIIWDYETGYVHLTGIWKASLNDQHSIEEASLPKSNSKADIVKLLESTPKQYQPYIKRIRGGFLKIQGTWLPFNLCKVLARRFCYHIRHELIPIFGTGFPEYCLKPSDKGFGELKLDEVPDENSLLSNGEIKIDPTKKSPKKKKSANTIISSNVLSFETPQHKMSTSHSDPNLSSLLVDSTPQRGQGNNKVVKKEHKKKHRKSSSISSVPLPVSKPMLPLPTPPSKLVTSPKLSVRTEFDRLSLTSPKSSQGLYKHQYQPPAPSLPTTAGPVSADVCLPPPAALTGAAPPKTGTFSHQHSKSDSVSYSDMMEIVNASKCLQSISRNRNYNKHASSGSESSSSVNMAPNCSSNDGSNASLQTSPINYEAVSANKNYVISSPKPKNTVESPTSGISSILVAAGISEDNHAGSRTKLPHTNDVVLDMRSEGKLPHTNDAVLDMRSEGKASMKINDLLS